MAKLASNLLNYLTIKSAKPTEKQYTLHDVRGLFLPILPNGSKCFQLRTLLHGKRQLIQIGVYSIVT